MEFHQLAAVVAVADHGSFTGAAEALGHSQPSISLAVRRLEREVGIALFERLSTGVVPTTAGEALLGPARQALRDRDIGLEAVADVSGLAAGHLDIACIPTLAADIATPILGAFRRRHDHVSIRLREPEVGSSVEDLVRRGQSELGFCALPADGTGLAQLLIEDQELVAVLSAGHAAAYERKGAIPIERLADLPLITAPEGASTHTQLAAALDAIGVMLVPGIVTDHRDTIVPLVLAGAGAAVLPRAVAETTHSPDVTVLPLHPAMTRSVGLVHRQTVLSPAARTIIELASQGRDAWL